MYGTRFKQWPKVAGEVVGIIFVAAPEGVSSDEDRSELQLSWRDTLR